MLRTDAITALHNYYRPQQSLISGMGRFNSSMYDADCMLIECPVGKRLVACASFWKWSRKQILDDDSINWEKKGLDGQWSQQATLLGFEINKETLTVQLRDEKVQQARTLVLCSEPSPGNYGVTVETFQRLRGLCVHWLTCNLFLDCLCHPIDLLLSHASESGLMI